MTGGPVMIKIDGAKVKHLRESQGLTQLYLATAVSVTTDTISRWENKRYPTIKQENGLKLAEALGVEVEELLDSDTTPQIDPTSPQPPLQPDTLPQSSVKSKFTLPLILFPLMALLILFAGGYFFLHLQKSADIKAVRIMPKRTIAELPFPVVIEVVGASQKPVSLILKENFPHNASLISTAPKTSNNGKNPQGIKWIQKMTGRSVFAYMIKLPVVSSSTSSFSGTISVHLEEEAPITVEGASSIQLGKHHWADSDGDNVISDREILTVYDQFSGIEGFDINIDLIERMWLGTEYSWDETTDSFTITP